MANEIIREDKRHLTTLIFNRPEKRNALNADALFSLGDLVREIDKEGKARVIILRGAGEKIFTSGGDVAGGYKEFQRTIEGLTYCIEGLINCPLPLVSMVYGPAIGAGLDISVISDFCFAAEDARFGVPLVKMGRTYYYTAIERLTRLVGIKAAKEILLTGSLINADRARETGLVNQVIKHDELERFTYSFANKLAEETAPLAVRVTKLTIKKLFEENRLDPSLEKELAGLVDEINMSKDAEEGIKAVMEKRKPVFTGR